MYVSKKRRGMEDGGKRRFDVCVLTINGLESL